MQVIKEYRHTILVFALSAFLMIAQPITASMAFGLLLVSLTPVFAILEWMLADEIKQNATK